MQFYFLGFTLTRKMQFIISNISYILINMCLLLFTNCTIKCKFYSDVYILIFRFSVF